MASRSLCDLCTFSLSLFLPILSDGTAGSVESWSWWRATGWLGKASPCHENWGNESNSLSSVKVEVWLTDKPNSCSGDVLWYIGTWVLLKYKGFMLVKGVQKHACINERKYLKKFSWYLQNIFSSICQTDWHFRYSYGFLFFNGRSIRYSWSPKCH